jgi:hypothetical protein
MNWSLIGGIVGALVINEISELSTSLARGILRLAARLEAGIGPEKDLIYNELRAIMAENVPGKLTQLFWAAGRLMGSVRFGFRRRMSGRDLKVRFIFWLNRLLQEPRDPNDRQLFSLLILSLFTISFVGWGNTLSPILVWFTVGFGLLSLILFLARRAYRVMKNESQIDRASPDR